MASCRAWASSDSRPYSSARSGSLLSGAKEGFVGGGEFAAGEEGEVRGSAVGDFISFRSPWIGSSVPPRREVATINQQVRCQKRQRSGKAELSLRCNNEQK